MADRVGQQLGNYRLIRLLGKGGFAEVYLGEHLYLKTTVDQTPCEGELAQRGIRAADLVLLVASPSTRSSRAVKEHLQIAGMYRRPVLCVCAAGDDMMEALPSMGEQPPIIDARQERYEKALDEIVAYLERELPDYSSDESYLTEPISESREPRNPYKGLRAFTKNDASDFFGRDALIAELIGKVKETLIPIAGLTLKDSENTQVGLISNAGALKLTNCLIAGNSATNLGTLFNTGTLTLSNTTISDNRAVDGGGIDNDGVLMLANSTISDNTALESGGGISNGGTLTIVNSTISGNRAGNFGGGLESGGGLASIAFSTIYGNTSTLSGGGIYIGIDAFNRPSEVMIIDSIVAGNRALTGPDIRGMLLTRGYNLIQDFSSATFADPLNKHVTDLLGKKFPDLRIDPILRNNGGSTQTHALLSGSPAIDQIPPEACQGQGIYTDQRGVRRPQGSACHIGAFEYKPS